MYKKSICIGIIIDNIILEESKTSKILNIVFIGLLKHEKLVCATKAIKLGNNSIIFNFLVRIA